MLRSLTRTNIYPLQKYVASPVTIIWCRSAGLQTDNSQDEKKKKQTYAYIQGQVHGKQREYFYYVDNHGRLYLNDIRLKNFLTAFKDKRFLADIFSKLNVNEGRHKEDFPFMVKCRRTETNYIGCESVPIVFTHLDKMQRKEYSTENFFLIYNHADPAIAVVPFRPSRLFMSDTGRMYHPGPIRTGGVGLISTELSLTLSQMLEFENGQDNAPTHIWWQNEKLLLDNDWYKDEYINSYVV